MLNHIFSHPITPVTDYKPLENRCIFIIEVIWIFLKWDSIEMCHELTPSLNKIIFYCRQTDGQIGIKCDTYNMNAFNIYMHLCKYCICTYIHICISIHSYTHSSKLFMEQSKRREVHTNCHVCLLSIDNDNRLEWQRKQTHHFINFFWSRFLKLFSLPRKKVSPPKKVHLKCVFFGSHGLSEIHTWRLYHLHTLRSWLCC